MPIEELNALGHEKKNLIKVVRAFCIECSGGSEAEARKCTATKCQLWPYRMGRNPFRKPMSEERKAELRERFKK